MQGWQVFGVVSLIISLWPWKALGGELSETAKLLALTQSPPSGSSLTLPPGTYRLCDQPGKGITLRGWEDKEIVADGVTLILKPGQSFTLENCRNIRVRGLTIDCDPLPWSEATLTTLTKVVTARA